MSKIDQIGTQTVSRPHGEIPVRKTEPQSEQSEHGGPSQAGNSWIWIVALLVVVGAIGFWVTRKPPAAANGGIAGKGKGPGVAVVPVGVGTVVQKDVPIYLDGLGTVQAFNTVTIHSRVDGQLDRVAFVEGQDVKAGDVLAQIDPKPFAAALRQAEAKQGEDEAQLTNAVIQLSRDQDLLTSKVLAQSDFDTQQALTAQLNATVKADQAAVESARVQLGYTTIVSPIDGRTGVRQLDQGNIIHANDVNGLVVITQLHPISVLFTLPQQRLGEIQEKMAQGELTVVTVDRDNHTVLATGKLAVVDNQIDTSTATIRLKATFANDDLKLWPGQFVNTRLLLATRKSGNVVPESTIQRGPDGPYVFVVQGKPDAPTVEVRKVTVGQIESGEALVEAGLRPGERVVVDGQYRLQAGSRVKIRAPGKAGDGAEGADSEP
jgi:multidrug efflux system membrane fusion protein